MQSCRLASRLCSFSLDSLVDAASNNEVNNVGSGLRKYTIAKFSGRAWLLSEHCEIWLKAIGFDKLFVASCSTMARTHCCCLNLLPYRPDLLYSIGVEIRKGRGPHSGTTILTFTPRFVISNQTNLRLQFAQRFCLDSLAHKSGKSVLVCLTTN